MYLKKHTVLQKLFSEKYHWGGGTSSQGAPNSLWQKHKLTAWWRRNLMQLWEAYAWETVAPHIPQCCRDFFFPRKCHLKHIYNWTQQRLWNWTGTAHLFEFFGKHFAGFFVFLCFFFLKSPMTTTKQLPDTFTESDTRYTTKQEVSSALCPKDSSPCLYEASNHHRTCCVPNQNNFNTSDLTRWWMRYKLELP